MIPIGYAVAATVLGGLLAAIVAVRILARRNARELADSEARLRAGFHEIATAALRDNSDLFLKLARESFGREQAGIQGSLNALIDPIRTALEKTETQVGAMERERRDAFSTLRAQIETMALGQSALQRETHNLVTALRRPEVRGRWGERFHPAPRGGAGRAFRALRLHRAAEPGRARQPAAARHGGAPAGGAAAGHRCQDAAGCVPGGRSMRRRTSCARNVWRVTRNSWMRACVNSPSKAYWSQFEHSPEFAVLFLPGDQFLSSALAES